MSPLVCFCCFQRRFPAELFLERYGQIALLTCCSTLATEADKIAHGMLQEIVDDVLQLAEVADDPSLGLHDFLKAVSTYGSRFLTAFSSPPALVHHQLLPASRLFRFYGYFVVSLCCTQQDQQAA